MITFKLAPCTRHPGDIVEVWRDGVFIAAIYPHGPDGIKIISKYLTNEGVISFAGSNLDVSVFGKRNIPPQ